METERIQPTDRNQDPALQQPDTICALATATGGALAIIRISGPQAIAITDSLFHAASGKTLATARGNTLHYGSIGNIDTVVVSLYRSPHSYTGEDAIEISCHGSKYIVRELLNALINAGCRQAGPGEYTRRAYLNGKMDLSQAEAVADLIAASNKASHDVAISQLKGHVRTALGELHQRLQKLTALLELELDFSDHEELEFADRSEIKSLTSDIDTRLRKLAATYSTGQAIKEGIPVAIVGEPNVGKSTLLNRLLGEDRAIVSEVPGTTRDTIEDTVEIGGLTFRFIDTAGLRETDDKVERMGISRAYQQIEKAKIVLWLVDTMPTDKQTAQMTELTAGKHLIKVYNKADLLSTREVQSMSTSPTTPPLLISAKDGSNVDELIRRIRQAADIEEIKEDDVIITSARQYNLLHQAITDLARVKQGLDAGLSSDLVAEDLRTVLNDLGEITGMDRITPASTLDTIFQYYCIGK